MRIKFNRGNIVPVTACYADDGNPNPGGGGGTQPGNQPQQQNNSGQPDPLASFWSDPVQPAPNPAPANPAPAPSNQQTQQPTSPFASAQQLMDSYKPTGFMNADVVNAMGTNDFTSFNQGMEAFGKDVLSQAAAVTVDILRTLVPQMMTQFNGMLDSRFNASDQTAFLSANIPQYKNPALAKQVTDVFNQAMKHTNGDRQKALGLTQSMLSAMGSAFAPPANNPSNIPTTGHVPDNWYQELGGIIES